MTHCYKKKEDGALNKIKNRFDVSEGDKFFDSDDSEDYDSLRPLSDKVNSMSSIKYTAEEEAKMVLSEGQTKVKFILPAIAATDTSSVQPVLTTTATRAAVQAILHSVTHEKADVQAMLDCVAQNKFDVQKTLARVTREAAVLQEMLNSVAHAKANVEDLLESVANEKAAVQEMKNNVADEKDALQGNLNSAQKANDDNGSIALNIGGVHFVTTTATLCRFPDTLIGRMFTVGRHTMLKDAEGRCFIDRDGAHFNHILNFLRDPGTFVMQLEDMHLMAMKREFEYFGLQDFITFPAPGQSSNIPEILPHLSAPPLVYHGPPLCVPVRDLQLKADIGPVTDVTLTVSQTGTGMWVFKADYDCWYTAYRPATIDPRCGCAYVQTQSRRHKANPNKVLRYGVTDFLKIHECEIVNSAQPKPTESTPCPGCGLL